MASTKAAAPGRQAEGGRENTAAEHVLNPEYIDLEQYLDAADRLMLAAVRSGGRFVLAVRCLVCGKPLTSRRSRALGVGPGCRRKGGDRR
ncbi:hypothetical protein GP2_054_00020 [Gordonia paraffinivorans NBRC 108238]|uniref:Uncharacterized protein n=1 Tax=Gordonia paraffinivorans NBRC 108238 TaxID=1223543 RepID=A0ABQ0IRA8_9ACTN|nr:hypothetical protein GP2_054_00020 [Gordonia paraffinivorans NBRC 108238]